MRYDAIRRATIRYATIRYAMLGCGTIRRDTNLSLTLSCNNAIMESIIESSMFIVTGCLCHLLVTGSIRYDAIRCDTLLNLSLNLNLNLVRQAMRCDAIRYATIRYEMIREDTITGALYIAVRVLAGIGKEGEDLVAGRISVEVV